MITLICTLLEHGISDEVGVGYCLAAAKIATESGISRLYSCIPGAGVKEVSVVLAYSVPNFNPNAELQRSGQY